MMRGCVDRYDEGGQLSFPLWSMRLALFVGVLIYGLSVAYGVPTANHDLRPLAATIGDELTYTLRVQAPTPVSLPNASDHFGSLAVKSSSVVTASILDAIQTDLTVTLVSFTVGEQVIPTVSIGELVLPAIPFEIISTLKSDTPPPPSTTFFVLPVRWLPYGIGIALLLVAIGGGAWAIRYWRSRQQTSLDRVVEPAVAPGPEALAALDVLRQSDAFQTANYRVVFDRMDAVFRRYIERQFQLSCDERSSTEILACLASVLDDQTYRRLSHCFELADWVKFADYEPNDSEVGLCFERATDVVERTMTL